jgi:hypothetical protein
MTFVIYDRGSNYVTGTASGKMDAKKRRDEKWVSISTDNFSGEVGF